MQRDRPPCRSVQRHIVLQAYRLTTTQKHIASYRRRISLGRRVVEGVTRRSIKRTKNTHRVPKEGRKGKGRRRDGHLVIIPFVDPHDQKPKRKFPKRKASNESHRTPKAVSKSPYDAVSTNHPITPRHWSTRRDFIKRRSVAFRTNQ